MMKMVTGLLIFVLLLVNASCSNPNKGVLHDISMSTEEAYIVESDCTISGNCKFLGGLIIREGVTCRILPGSVLEFNHSRSWIVNRGNLIAHGTEFQPIKFLWLSGITCLDKNFERHSNSAYFMASWRPPTSDTKIDISNAVIVSSGKALEVEPPVSPFSRLAEGIKEGEDSAYSRWSRNAKLPQHAYPVLFSAGRVSLRDTRISRSSASQWSGTAIACAKILEIDGCLLEIARVEKHKQNQNSYYDCLQGLIGVGPRGNSGRHPFFIAEKVNIRGLSTNFGSVNREISQGFRRCSTGILHESSFKDQEFSFYHYNRAQRVERNLFIESTVRFCGGTLLQRVTNTDSVFVNCTIEVQGEASIESSFFKNCEFVVMTKGSLLLRNCILHSSKTVEEGLLLQNCYRYSQPERAYTLIGKERGSESGKSAKEILLMLNGNCFMLNLPDSVQRLIDSAIQ